MAKRIPQRSCIGCGAKKEKAELIRIVNNTEDKIVFDPNGRLSGRGAYICKNAGCLKLSQKKKSLERAFRKKNLQEIYEMLEKIMNEMENIQDHGAG